ncbi:hypothetical protein P3342_000780 [Pyrenophora teres f. teres]|nr:hypothetical protein P3342_000780 [Pyrenophora teres f. teres]
MLPLHESAGVVSPYVSLLMWFRNPPAVAAEDEESKCGVFSDTDHTEHPIERLSSRNDQCIVKDAVAFCYLWCAFSIIVLGSFGLYLAVDLVFNHYGMGTGMAQWVLDRHQFPSITSYGMQFCLDTPQRDAPSPQTWHYMVPGINDHCTTDTIAFIIDPSESWKIHSEDYLTLGYNVRHKDRQVRALRTLAAEENVRA